MRIKPIKTADTGNGLIDRVKSKIHWSILGTLQQKLPRMIDAVTSAMNVPVKTKTGTMVGLLNSKLF